MSPAAPSPLSPLPPLGRRRVTASVRTAAHLVALPTLLLATALPAQAPGDLVRLRGEPAAPWRTGRLVARTDSALVLRIDGEYVRDTTAGAAARGRWMPARDDTIPLAAVRQLEVRRHKANRGGRAVLGGLVGGIGGGLVGVLLSNAGVGQNPYRGDFNPGPVIIPGIGATFGLLVGAVVGANSAKPTRWEPVVLPAPTPR